MGKLLQFPQRIIAEIPDLAVNAGPASVRILPAPESTPAITLFTSYLRRERAACENTVESYLLDLEQFQTFLYVANKTFEQASRRDVREWLAAKMGEGLSPRAAARKLSTLRTFYRLLLDEERIQTLPTNGVPIPKIWKKLPTFIELSELEAMVRWTEKQKGPTAIRDKAILLVLFASGLRVAELVNLKLADVDLDAGIVRVWAGKGGKDGIAPLSPLAIEALTVYLQTLRPELDRTRSPHVFLPLPGKNKPMPKMTRQGVFHRVRNIARKAIGRDVHPHEFRHGCGTALIKGGADIRDVQAVLRHSDIDTTQIYNHCDITYLRGVYDKCHPRAKGRRGVSRVLQSAKRQQKHDPCLQP
jgi:site-specific recombinase XerD